MYELITRIIDIVEQGTYGGESLGVTGLRLLPPTLEGRKIPVMIPLLRNSNEYTPLAGDYQRTQGELSFELRFFMARIKPDRALDYIKLHKKARLATQIFLSRPQLELSSINDGMVHGGSIRFRLSSGFTTPQFYPPNIPPDQATPYWGFSAILSLPETLVVRPYPEGA